MKAMLCASVLVLLPPVASATAAPGDSAAGKQLHDENCMGCHDTSVYTRADHRIQSFAALQEQLNNCSHAINRQFSATDRENLLTYLNDQFYHFQQ